MTIRTDLMAALPPVLATLVDELGVLAAVKRPTETRELDGTASHTWSTIHASARVILQPLEERVRRELWGAETRARVQGIAPSSLALALSDAVVPAEGHFSGRPLEIVERQQYDEAGAVLLGLVEVEARPAPSPPP